MEFPLFFIPKVSCSCECDGMNIYRSSHLFSSICISRGNKQTWLWVNTYWSIKWLEVSSQVFPWNLTKASEDIRNTIWKWIGMCHGDGLEIVKFHHDLSGDVDTMCPKVWEAGQPKPIQVRLAPSLTLLIWRSCLYQHHQYPTRNTEPWEDQIWNSSSFGFLIPKLYRTVSLYGFEMLSGSA